jgi:predicted DsbA family dithiol-disulfide isomerase
LEIHPDTPKEGVPMTDRFPASALERMQSNLRSYGRLYGIDFNGSGLLSNSHYALAVGEFAKYKGKFEEFHEKVFHAYFTEGRDIGNIKVLSDIAESIGLNKEEMMKSLEEGAYEKALDDTQEMAYRHEISSTPTFIIDDKYAVVGAQSIDNFRNTLLEIEKK